jgi:beta-glucosidase
MVMTAMTTIFVIVGLLLTAYIGYRLYFRVRTRMFLGMLEGEGAKSNSDQADSASLYRDASLPIEERIEDLLTRMTLEEKAGLMFICMIGMNKDGSVMERPGIFNPKPTSELIAGKLMNHFNIIEGSDPAAMARWSNAMQTLASRTRLGIPVTIATDPRHAFNKNPLAGLAAGGFSQWPEPLGLAASRDMELIAEFGDIARQEYLQVGIRLALHPTADLATEPRWGRTNHTFGENADLSGDCTAAYLSGFQGKVINADSVICMTKHFPGGGPQKDGEDAHFEYGKEQVYPGDNFDYHLGPFEKAFEAGTGQIMPYYGKPVGLEGIEEVGFGFNKDVLTGLLREKYKFDGVVCTDWNILTDSKTLGLTILPARAWGVEHLSTEERMLKALEAGADQFGGEYIPEVLVALVNNGEVSEARLDESVRRLLRDKFRLGLFDQPFADPQQAAEIVGSERFKAAGERAQRKSFVLLKNGDSGQGAAVLPLPRKAKLYVEGIAADVASSYGEVVAKPEQADFAILRLEAPYQPRKGLVARFFHTGDLDFKGAEKDRILKLLKTLPTVVDINLERPAVIPEIAELSAGLLANFGATDAAALDVIFGDHNPSGRLPFEMPSSMEAVRQSREDVPSDTENPVYPYGHGLSYE